LIGKIAVCGQSEEIVHELLSPKNTQTKMDWRCGSSSNVPALQALGFILKCENQARVTFSCLDFILWAFEGFRKKVIQTDLTTC
jgi:hypothetical protein